MGDDNSLSANLCLFPEEVTRCSEAFPFPMQGRAIEALFAHATGVVTAVGLHVCLGVSVLWRPSDTRILGLGYMMTIREHSEPEAMSSYLRAWSVKQYKLFDAVGVVEVRVGDAQGSAECLAPSELDEC